MPTFAQIMTDAQAEGIELDVELCGGARPYVPTPQEQDKAEAKAFKAKSIDAYRSQTVASGTKKNQYGSETIYDAPEGGFVYDVDELRLYKAQLRFCELMISVGIMNAEDFETELV